VFDLLFKLCLRLKSQSSAIGESLRTRSSWPPLEEGGVPGSEYHLPLDSSPYGRDFRAGKYVRPSFGAGVEGGTSDVSGSREAANDLSWVDTIGSQT